MLLPSNLSNLWEVGGLVCRANLEDWGLPLLALLSQILVFSSFGGNSSLKVNVLELRKRVACCDGNVGLLIFSLLLCLLLLLLTGSEVFLGSVEVSLEGSLRVLRIVLGVLLCLLDVKVDIVSDAIQLVDIILDLLGDHLLKNWTHDTEKQRLHESEEQLVLGLLEFDAHVLDVDGHVIDLEEVVLITLVGSLKGSLETEAASTKEDVHDTLVSN